MHLAGAYLWGRTGMREADGYLNPIQVMWSLGVIAREFRVYSKSSGMKGFW